MAWGASLKRLARTLTPRPVLEARRALRPEAALANPYVAGKLLEPPTGDIVVARAQRSEDAAHLLPIPPRQFWEGYGNNEDEYLASGREHTDAMLAVLLEANIDPEVFRRVLDFGCAAGRMLRCFPRSENRELWGADIKANTIAWCQQNLSPSMRFCATTTAPHLPFEDGYFDFVYSGSVFTHIADLPDAWLLELRRIISDDGYGYVTIFDKHALKLVMSRYQGDPLLGWFVHALRDFNLRTSAFEQDFAWFSVDAGEWSGMPVPQVCYDIGYLKERWSSFIQIVSVTEEAYGFQTAVLFRK
jgi:SAM-dependent methyltransferase